MTLKKPLAKLKALGDEKMRAQDNKNGELVGSDKPVEITPGKFDSFFTPGFPILERFVGDRSGRVVGIVYTLGYSEVEAKRVR